MSRGLDPFKIAGASISGWYPSFKTASGRHPFTSLLELALGLYLEFHPLVVSYQRGDLSPEFARSHKLDVPLGAPYAIGYAFDGKPHEYLPDYVGTLRGGGLLVAEAGRVEHKAEARSRAKLAAAKRLTELKGGEVWIGTEESLSRRWQHNLIFLLTRRLGFPTFPELASHIVDIWRSEEACVAEVVARLGARWPEVEVEAAAWKVVGDSAAQGRVVIDFEGQALSLYTPLRLLSPAEPPILPSPLPHSLPWVESAGDLTLGEDSEELLQAGYLPGAVIDAGGIPSEEARATFLRNLAAVTDVLSGMALREASRRHGISPGQLSKLVKRGLKLGQIALVPYLSYEREPQLREEFRELIRRLYKRRSRPSITAVFEDPKLKRLAEELTQTEGSLVRLPTYWQVYRYIRSIENEPDVAVARSGSAHPPKPRTSPYSFVLSIPAPALLCQVDEHYLDVLVVALDGTVITNRVHAAVLICVKTAAILGAVLCLDTLKEEDYMRLVRQAIEPKDRLVALYGCKHPWPCHGKPSVIFHDRGKVFTSERATRVLVDRLGIVTEEAPPYAPTAK